MTKVKTIRYSEAYVQRIHDDLKDFSQQGKPRYYEIKVDGLPSVRRTNDVGKFDNYMEMVNDGTRIVEIILYSSHPKSFNSERYILELEPSSQEEKKSETKELSGIEIDAKIQAAVEREREKNHLTTLEKELTVKENDLKEAREYIKKLEDEVLMFRGKKLQWGNVNIGEFASVVLEGMVRRNPQMIAKLPGGEALAGIIAEDNKNRLTENPTSPEGEVTFTKASGENRESLTEDQLRFLKVLELLEENFEQHELVMINAILERLIQNREDLKTIASLLGID